VVDYILPVSASFKTAINIEISYLSGVRKGRQKGKKVRRAEGRRSED